MRHVEESRWRHCSEAFKIFFNVGACVAHANVKKNLDTRADINGKLELVLEQALPLGQPDLMDPTLRPGLVLLLKTGLWAKPPWSPCWKCS